MGRDDGTVDAVDMFLQIFDLFEILLWQTVARRIGNVHHRGTRLDDGLHHTSEVFIVGSSGVLAVELHVIYIALGILCGGNGHLEDMLAVGVEFILDVLIGSSDACVDTLMLGIFQRIEGHIDITLYRTGQRTNHWPRHGL